LNTVNYHHFPGILTNPGLRGSFGGESNPLDYHN